MQLDLTTPAIIFPAISLLMLAYTNKFLALSSIIRQLSAKAIIASDASDKNLIKQIRNLRLRISLLKVIQSQALLSIFNCLISIILLYTGITFWGNLFFVLSLVLMMMSILVAIVETMISGNALNIELEKLEKK